MNTFLLSFDATTSVTGSSPPTLEVLIGGLVVSSVVMQSGATEPSQLRRQIGQLAARYLEQVLTDNMTMAICFGSTTYEVIAAIRPDFQANVTVVQSTGSLSYALKEYDSSALTLFLD